MVSSGDLVAGFLLFEEGIAMKIPLFMVLSMCFLLACLSPVELHAAGAVVDIPVYPGAVLEESAADSFSAHAVADIGEDEGVEPDLASGSYALYAVEAGIEEIFDYYRRELHAFPDRPGPGPSVPGPGESTAVTYLLDYYGFSSDNSGITHRDRGIEPLIKAARRVYGNGRWIYRAVFYWGRRESSGAYTEFTLTLLDDGLSEDQTSYKPRTKILIELDVYKSPDARRGSFRFYFAHRPLPARIFGFPPYPGAPLWVNLSAFQSAPTTTLTYAFITMDPVSTVVEYYERNTKYKATARADGRCVFCPHDGLAMDVYRLEDNPDITIISISGCAGPEWE